LPAATGRRGDEAGLASSPVAAPVSFVPAGRCRPAPKGA